MNIVRIETVDQMRGILRRIFFRAQDEVMEFGEPSEYDFDELCDYLQINPTDMIDPSIDPGSDQWDMANDMLSGDDIKHFALDEGKCPLIKNFTPGVLVWCLEDGFDRVSGYTVRVFIFSPDDECSYESHLQWLKRQQQEYDEQRELRSRIMAMDAQARSV